MFDLFPFVVGLLGSLHCLGMCGPIVLAYSIHLKDFKSSTRPEIFSWRKTCLYHLSFHTGRLITYGMLGALAAGLFNAADVSRLAGGLRGSMTLFGGILLVFLGLALLKIVPVPAFLTNASAVSGSLLGRWIPFLFRSGSPVSKIALGLVVGFAPCCLSWAMIITAATTQKPIAGFLTMIYFGLGTIPVLFLTGLSTSFLSLKVRFFGERMAALSVTALGFILVLEGAGIIA